MMVVEQLSKLKNRLKAIRKLDQRRGKGYFSNKNNIVVVARQDELALMRAKVARRRAQLEQAAMASILRGQRELERVAA